VAAEVSRQAGRGRPLRLLFQDEARFGRLSNPRPCWAPSGLRPEVGAQRVREYSYAFAAVAPRDGVLHSLVLPEVGSETMSLFLAQVAHHHLDDFILMVLDGAAWHSAHDLEVPPNMRLLPLPPYSPQLNPVENLWDEIREKWFSNLLFDSPDAVEDRLVDALGVLHRDCRRVQSVTGFQRIVNIPLNAY